MRSGSTEFLNISHTVLSVMQEIASGTIHRRDIEDRLRIPGQQALRAIEKLREAGLIRVVAARDPARAGLGVRLYRCYPTATGRLMLKLCAQIEQHRGLENPR